ncbi:MAG: hypothetical protein RBU27_01995 [Bacteroidota bacterium]|nr:hypothetical protein [Bacteroidota bacterium]
MSLHHPIPSRTHFVLPLLFVVAALLSGCASVELSSILDTQFLLTTRDLPFNSVLVVYDSKDLARKQEFEHAFAAYLREHTDAQIHADIDLYSPLKRLEEKEKTWALRDNSIQAVLYMHGGGGGRSLRDWLLPEAPDLDTETPAWKSSAVKLFLPATAQVVWAGSVMGHEGYVGEELRSRAFFSAVVADLVGHGMLDMPRVDNPALRGFNR